MVLAAGLGLRMRPLTDLVAKPALPVLNRPLLAWTLERLQRAGATEVVINTHHRPGTVRQAAAQMPRPRPRLRYSHEARILGTGGGPRKVRELFRGEPLVLLVNGDVLFDFDLKRLVERHLASGARATLALKPMPKAGGYSPVVTGRGGWIRSIGVRRHRGSSLVSLFAGVHVLDPALLDRLPAGASDSVRDLYAPMLAAGERLLGVRLAGSWLDLGRPDRYLRSQLRMLKQRADLTRGGSLVGRGGYLGRGARVEGSVVGPGAFVGEGAIVRRSLLWAGARVAPGAVVLGSILARGARIAPGERIVGQVVVAKRRTPLGA